MNFADPVPANDKLSGHGWRDSLLSPDLYSTPAELLKSFGHATGPAQCADNITAPPKPPVLMRYRGALALPGLHKRWSYTAPAQTQFRIVTLKCRRAQYPC